MNNEKLNWPAEFITADIYTNPVQLDKNSCLDLHGNPMKAGLTILSDGNHHKALLETCHAFKRIYPEVKDIFFVTAPPTVLLSILDHGTITLDNLTLTIHADLIISPASIIKDLHKSWQIRNHHAFAASKHNSLLVNARSPGKITSIFDLTRKDTTLAISNPETEKASFAAYSKTLENFGQKIHRGDFLEDILKRCVFSRSIHHREIPELILNNRADAALLYHHLAKSYIDRFPGIFKLIEYVDDYPDIDEITTYHAGLINRENPLAEKFSAFLLQEESREIYQANGLANVT